MSVRSQTRVTVGWRPHAIFAPQAAECTTVAVTARRPTSGPSGLGREHRSASLPARSPTDNDGLRVALPRAARLRVAGRSPVAPTAEGDGHPPRCRRAVRRGDRDHRQHDGRRRTARQHDCGASRRRVSLHAHRHDVDSAGQAAVRRPGNGSWYVLRSEDSSFFAVPFGATGDVPAPADYDGDGKADLAVFRPDGANWFIQRSTAGILIQQVGATGDVPTPAAFVR